VARDYLPQTYNLSNELLREIVTLATNIYYFFISLHKNETGLDKK